MLNPKSIKKLKLLPNQQRSEILKGCCLISYLKLKTYDFIILHGYLLYKALYVITHDVSSDLCSQS